MAKAGRSGSRSSQDVPRCELGNGPDVDDLGTNATQPPDVRDSPQAVERRADQGRAAAIRSARRRKYDGKLPRELSRASTNASSDGARSSAFVVFSPPIVDVRSVPDGAVQNEPAP